MASFSRNRLLSNCPRFRAFNNLSFSICQERYLRQAEYSANYPIFGIVVSFTEEYENIEEMLYLPQPGCVCMLVIELHRYTYRN